MTTNYETKGCKDVVDWLCLNAFGILEPPFVETRSSFTFCSTHFRSSLSSPVLKVFIAIISSSSNEYVM